MQAHIYNFYIMNASSIQKGEGQGKKIKVDFTPKQAAKAQRGSRGIEGGW
jgi:hypothetical protein